MDRAITTALIVMCCISIVAVPSVWANWIENGVAICTAVWDQEYPQIISDNAGGAIITWEDERGGSWNIYAQRVDASGAVRWTANGVAICTAPGEQYSARIISDGAGGAVVAWWDFRSGSGLPDIYAQRVDASGAVRWTANGVVLCTAVMNLQSPRIASDGAGGAIVTWMDHCGGSWDISAQRVNASGDVQWTVGGIALCAETADQTYPAITSDGAGGAIVAWEDLRNGTWDIYAQRVDTSGAVQWTTDGIPLCTAMVNQQSAKITSDGAGGAIVTWDDYRSGSNWDIYAQKVNASGTAQWTGNGVELCAATGEQSYLMIVSDGAGSAIVSWHDLRSGNNYDIYAQKVDGSGAVQWTTDGVALCTASGDQGAPAIIADGTGGAVVTWMDRRSGSNYDIYAQRVNALGSVQWTADGVTICAATLDQYYPTITSDGWGGAIVAWYDNRRGDNDIYALRVDANGFAPLTDADAPAVPVALNQNYPNPFNPATTIAYTIAEEDNVTLMIFDASGRRIACLVDAQLEKGFYEAEWNGKDENGNPVASGIYLYRLTAGNRTLSRKMVLLR